MVDTAIHSRKRRISFHNFNSDYPVDRAITAFEQPEPGHASRGLLQEVKNNENVKTVAPMQRVVAVNLLRKARGPGGFLG